MANPPRARSGVISVAVPCIVDTPNYAAKEECVARKTVLVSDVSGQEIPEGKGATVRITWRSEDMSLTPNSKSPAPAAAEANP